MHCSTQRCDNETRVLQTHRCHFLMFTSLEILTRSLELFLRDWTMSIPCMTQYKSSLRRTNPNDVDYKSRSSESPRILWCPRTESVSPGSNHFFVRPFGTLIIYFAHSGVSRSIYIHISTSSCACKHHHSLSCLVSQIVLRNI